MLEDNRIRKLPEDHKSTDIASACKTGSALMDFVCMAGFEPVFHPTLDKLVEIVREAIREQEQKQGADHP